MPTVTGIATSFIDFTRASNATVTDSDGKVKWAPHNLLLASEQFDAAAWTKASVTVTANYAAAPNGTTTADRVVYVGGLGTPAIRQISQQIITGANAGLAYTFGVWLSGTGSVRIRNTQVAVLDTYSSNITLTATPTFYSLAVTNGSSAGIEQSVGIVAVAADTAFDATVWGAHLYRSDLAMQPNTSAYPMYNPTTPKNLLGFTEDVSNAAWTKFNLAAFGSGSVSNAIVAPNGLQTADLIVEDTTNGYHGIYTTFTGVINTPYVWSGYAKAAGRTLIQFAAQSSGTICIFEFNLTGAGSATNRSGTGTATITALSDGWYRFSVTATATSSGTGYWQINLCNAANSTSYAGNGTSGIYVWGAQLSDSASLDPYAPVYGAAVTSAAYYGPRRDFDPVTLACKGLLVEEQRTNLLLYSANMTAAPFWTGYSVALVTTANSATAPDGFTTANTITLSANTRVQILTGLTSGLTYTLSVWLRTDSGTKNITLTDINDTGFNTVSVDTTWRRYSYTYSKTNTIAYVGISQIAGTSPSTSGTLYAWGWQLEANASFATSYIPTGVATATRTADLASVSTQAFPYSATAGTYVANFQTLYTGNTASTGTVIAHDTSASKLLIYLGGAAQNSASFDGSSAVFTADDVTGAIAKVASTYDASGRSFCTNSSAVATGTVAGSYSTASTTNLASSGTANQLNGWLRQVTYLPRKLSNAEIQTRTA